MKLGKGRDINSKIAALDCRALIRYDTNFKALKFQETLVQSFVKIIFNIPESREFMHTCYASEPVLAEAASQILNELADNEGRIEHQAASILHYALNSSLLAKGELGEMVARILFLVARDMAVIKSMSEQQRNVERFTGLQFSKPIPLLDFLKSLCSPESWEIVRSATPHHTYENSPTLETKYKDAWVNFSHFMEVKGEAFTLQNLPALLMRNAGIHAGPNQASFDGTIGVFHGDPLKDAITLARVGPILFQIKNWFKLFRVVTGDIKTMGFPKGDLPIMTITMHLGHEAEKPVVVTTKDRSLYGTRGSADASKDIRSRHYDLTFFGCTSKTYGCVPEDVSYSKLLRSEDPLKGFQHGGVKESLDLAKELTPIYDSKRINRWAYRSASPE